MNNQMFRITTINLHYLAAEHNEHSLPMLTVDTSSARLQRKREFNCQKSYCWKRARRCCCAKFMSINTKNKVNYLLTGAEARLITCLCMRDVAENRKELSFLNSSTMQSIIISSTEKTVFFLSNSVHKMSWTNFWRVVLLLNVFRAKLQLSTLFSVVDIVHVRPAMQNNEEKLKEISPSYRHTSHKLHHFAGCVVERFLQKSERRYIVYDDGWWPFMPTWPARDWKWRKCAITWVEVMFFCGIKHNRTHERTFKIHFM